MAVTQKRIRYLLEVWSSRKATREEEQELIDRILEKGEEGPVSGHIRRLVETYAGKEPMPAVDWEYLYERILEKRETGVAPLMPKEKFLWRRWAVAAAAVLLLATGTYLWLTRPDNRSNRQLAAKPALLQDVAAPVGSKATLTVEGGKQIVLDSAANGSLAAQGAANASKRGGELVYTGSPAVVTYHTLTLPRGSQPMQVLLADGTLVWLNAASSISFPTAFPGSERRVSLSGEAYFEVAKNTGKKFLVTAGGSTTEVMGTHFNINAYNNEPAVRVTLLEGSVQVVQAGGTAVLHPGQQARLFSGGPIQVDSGVNTEEVMAWKNGIFEFDETDIQTIMRQLERWYDVEVVYGVPVSQHFSGRISRQVNASGVLTMLEKTGGIHFRIEGKKVIVQP